MFVAIRHDLPRVSGLVSSRVSLYAFRGRLFVGHCEWDLQRDEKTVSKLRMLLIGPGSDQRCVIPEWDFKR